MQTDSFTGAEIDGNTNIESDCKSYRGLHFPPNAIHRRSRLTKVDFGPMMGEYDMKSSINQEQIKNIIKTALIEVLEERQDLFPDAIEDALEDVALAHAIAKGEGSELVQRQEVFKLLEGKR